MLKIYRTSQKLWSIPQRFIICMLVTFSSSNSTIETIPSGSCTCGRRTVSRKHFFSCQKWRSSIAYGKYCCFLILWSWCACLTYIAGPAKRVNLVQLLISLLISVNIFHTQQQSETDNFLQDLLLVISLSAKLFMCYS